MANAYAQRMSKVSSMRSEATLETSNNKPNVIKKEQTRAGSVSTSGRRVREEHTSQARWRRLSQGSSDGEASSAAGDVWVESEDDRNSPQARVMTPSSSAGGSLGERQDGQAPLRELDDQSKAKPDGFALATTFHARGPIDGLLNVQEAPGVDI